MVKKTLVLSLSCGNNGSGSLSINRNSRVEHFEYQGYGDTVVAMLFGEILCNILLFRRIKNQQLSNKH
jgi:hypothetical protein